jgi:hypothetical protein
MANKSRRRQRGGANESLSQGQAYAKFHMNQHGGSRDLVGAPLDYSGVLDSSLRGSAGLTKYDGHFAAATAASHPQSGGSRRRRQRQSRQRQRQRQSRQRQRQSRQRQRQRQSRRQRGGYLSPADVGAPHTLLSSYAGTGTMPPPANGPMVPYTVTGGDRFPPMKGGRRSRRRRQRGGYAPISQPSMLMSSEQYSKAGLPSFKDPLLQH